MNQGQPTTPDDRSMGFAPVKGGTETTSAEGLLVTAYLVMWALIFGFLVLGWRRQGQVEKRLAVLERTLDGGKVPPP
jgi:CcmD family protein